MDLSARIYPRLPPSVHRQTSRGYSSQNSSGTSDISFLRMRVIEDVERIEREILDSRYLNLYLCENLFIDSLVKKMETNFFAKRTFVSFFFNQFINYFVNECSHYILLMQR